MNYLRFTEMQNVPIVILEPADYDAMLAKMPTGMQEYSDGIYAGIFINSFFFCKDLKSG